jgi:predicted RNA binding protein YcfA (HicA-like mRNA interferase family)
MTVDYPKLRSVTARQLASALQADGFQVQRQKGSHRNYRHPDGRRVTLSFHHSSETFRPGTL